LEAIERVFPETKTSRLMHKAKYRNPDLLRSADELFRMTHDFTKIQAARDISQCMDIANNRSPSFNHTINAIRQLCANNSNN
jgi:hypothetical protein